MAATSPHSRRFRLSDVGFAWLLAAPGLALILAIVLYPLVRSLYNAFFKVSLVLPGQKFVGLDNIVDVLKDDFAGLLGQTMIFTVGATVFSFLIGLGLALALNQKIRGAYILRGVFLIPWLIPGVVVSFLWMWIFNANYGVFNGVLQQLGIIDSPHAWLFSTGTARAALIIAKTWNSFPWIMVMLLAALQAVPNDLYEAARLDNTNSWQRFWNVTWPHIRPVAAMVILMEFIWNFQHFDTIFVLTGGGPAGTTDTFATAVYSMAFSGFNLGSAGALGLLWMAILLIFVIFYVQFSERGQD